MKTNEFVLRPACRSDRPGGCSTCNMAYDCQSKAQGRVAGLPMLALALILVGALAMLF